MPVKIRLMRIGAKKRPFYRVVAVDEQRKRTGGYLELLGTYNPLTQPKEIILKQDRIDDWVKKGAQYSDGFLRIIGKAPQRFRKPKKESKEEASKVEETVKEESKSEGVTESGSEDGGQKTEDGKTEEVVETPREEVVTAAEPASEEIPVETESKDEEVAVEETPVAEEEVKE